MSIGLFEQRLFLVEFPRLPAHRTLLREHLWVQPLDDAVHVETMRAFTPDQRTIVAGQRTLRAAALEWHSADAAVLVVGNPAPGGHGHPVYTRWMRGGVVEWVVLFVKRDDTQKKSEFEEQSWVSGTCYVECLLCVSEDACPHAETKHWRRTGRAHATRMKIDKTECDRSGWGWFDALSSVVWVCTIAMCLCVLG